MIFSAVLAAGLGKRMKSDLPKVLHPILGRPMILYVLDALNFLPQENVHIIVGHKADLVKEEIEGNYSYVLQEKQLGTGHALMQLEPYLSSKSGTLLVVPGDMPLIQRCHLEELLNFHEERKPLATILTARVDYPSSLGRVIRKKDGSLERIVEESDASPSELGIKEVCTSVYAFKLPDLFRFLKMVKPENVQKEYYLTDVVPLMQAVGKVEAVTVEDIPCIGVNDREQLFLCQKILRSRLFSRLMKEGVTLEDTETIFIDWNVKIGRDTVIKPFTMLEGKTVVGEFCILGPFLWLKDATIEDHSEIKGIIERSAK
ncbi:MAG: NTP transferase domain-containing protein [Coprothermobacterota bacterium]|nr:NTP transferase domain-containing protein [Coprothermobacterota bacterium]